MPWSRYSPSGMYLAEEHAPVRMTMQIAISTVDAGRLLLRVFKDREDIFLCKSTILF
jgi:hypothetical protein